MIRVLGNLPTDCYIACSGGVDSMAALSFLINHPQRKVEVLFFDHGTDTSKAAKCFLMDFCIQNAITFHSGKISALKPRRKSLEEHWRDERYKFFEEFSDKPIVFGHHLDDVVENYVFTMINGNEFLIPYKRDNYLRPFLATPKNKLIEWCKNKNVPWLEDCSNEDNTFSRNRIRNVLLPEIKKINPGIQKVVAKKIINAYNELSRFPVIL